MSSQHYIKVCFPIEDENFFEGGKVNPSHNEVVDEFIKAFVSYMPKDVDLDTVDYWGTFRSLVTERCLTDGNDWHIELENEHGMQSTIDLDDFPVYFERQSKELKDKVVEIDGKKYKLTPIDED